MRTPVIDRLLSKVKYDHGCWLFQGCLHALGYGRISIGGGVVRLTHRVAYQELVGEVPSKMDLDHLCRNRACCNPLHLEPVTRAENVRRGIETAPAWQRAKTHCPSGHLYGEPRTVNTRLKGPKKTRTCRICARGRRGAQ